MIVDPLTQMDFILWSHRVVLYVSFKKSQGFYNPRTIGPSVRTIYRFYDVTLLLKMTEIVKIYIYESRDLILNFVWLLDIIELKYIWQQQQILSLHVFDVGAEIIDSIMSRNNIIVCFDLRIFICTVWTGLLSIHT